MPFGGRLEREAEGRGSRERDGHAVRHHVVVGVISLGPEVADLAGDRVGVGVRDVDAGVAEAQPRERGGHRHLGAGFEVLAVADGGAERARHQHERVLRPHVGDRVRPAVGHALVGALVLVGGIRARGVALQRVAQDVEAGRRRDAGGLGDRELGVDDGEGRTQPRVRDAGLDVLVQDVEHADRGALAAGAGGGRDGHEREQRVGGGLGAPDRGVDVVHQVAIVGDQQVHRLCGVDAAATADRHDRVERTFRTGELDGLDHAGVGRLDAGAVVDDGLETIGLELPGQLIRCPSGGDPWVGDHQHPPRTQLTEVECELVPRADAELEPGGTIGEDRLGMLGPEA